MKRDHTSRWWRNSVIIYLACRKLEWSQSELMCLSLRIWAHSSTFWLQGDLSLTKKPFRATHSSWQTNSMTFGSRSFLWSRSSKRRFSISTSIMRAQECCQTLIICFALAAMKMTFMWLLTLKISQTWISWQTQSSSVKWAKWTKMKFSNTSTGMLPTLTSPLLWVWPLQKISLFSGSNQSLQTVKNQMWT